MANSTFENKHILITGASGFIGHALAKSLSRVECCITRCSRDSERLIPLQGQARVINKTVEYNNPESWASLVDGVDFIFFLGAQTSAKHAGEDPGLDFSNSVLPLLNLLEHCKKSGRKPAIVFASTATVIGLTEKLPVAENIYENPITVYDIHKLCCEKYLSYYSKIGCVKACSLRLANIYGAGQNPSSADRGILNLMISRAIQRQSLSIFGPGQQVRDYSHIADIVEAFEAAAEHIDTTNGRHFNIGSGQGHNFVEAFTKVADIVKSRLGHDTTIEHVAAPTDLALIETRNYVADTKSFCNTTGWSTKIELEEGIRMTVEKLLEQD